MAFEGIKPALRLLLILLCFPQNLNFLLANGVVIMLDLLLDTFNTLFDKTALNSARIVAC